MFTFQHAHEGGGSVFGDVKRALVEGGLEGGLL